MAKILIVDDSKFMRLVLTGMLEKKGAHKVVGEAEDGSLAVAKYKEVNPDLVTMDLIMPVVSGVQAVKDLIKHDANAKIVIISAMGQEKIIEELMQLGAKGFVIKPVSPEKLLETIGKVLGVGAQG